MLDWPKVNSALQVVVGVEIAFLLLTLPYFSGLFLNVGWAAVTVCVVISPNVGEGLKKCALRVLGTFAGGIVGYTILHCLYYGPGGGDVLDSWENDVCLHVLIAPVYFTLQYLRKTYPDNGYAFLMCMLSCTLVISYCHTRDSLKPMYVFQRVGTIALGVVIGFMAMIVVFPIRAIDQLINQVSQTYIKLGSLSADVIDLYRMGMDGSTPTSELDKRRNDLFEKVNSLSGFAVKQKALLEAAEKEWRFMHRNKNWREISEGFKVLINFGERVFFSLTTLYFMTAVEATGHLEAKDTKKSAAMLTRRSTAVRRTTVWQVNAIAPHYNYELIKLGLRQQQCLQLVGGVARIIQSREEAAKLLDEDLLPALDSLEAEVGDLIQTSERDIASRLNNTATAETVDPDEMMGYTSVLSLLRLITLQLAFLGATLCELTDALADPGTIRPPLSDVAVDYTCTDTAAHSLHHAQTQPATSGYGATASSTPL